MKNQKSLKTATISTRIDADLKERFMQYLEDNEKTLSKWLRKQVEKELKKEK